MPAADATRRFSPPRHTASLLDDLFGTYLHLYRGTTLITLSGLPVAKQSKPASSVIVSRLCAKTLDEIWI
jgi:hypothetical protein